VYIERKEDGVNGPARIGRVTFSQSERSIYYAGRMLQKFKGGFKANYFDVETRQRYWVLGCKTVETDSTGEQSRSTRMSGKSTGSTFGTCQRRKISSTDRGNTIDKPTSLIQHSERR
jgi:hypothetical protein